MPDVADIVEMAAKLYPPFVGLISWKYRFPASALYHSLSVAAIAGGIAKLLTTNEDEVDLSTYGGLVHDFYQKGSSVGLTKEKGREILRLFFREEGFEEKLIGEVLELVNYNVAENPKVWAGKHPIASLSIWLADTIAGTYSAFTIHSEVTMRAERLSELQQKLLESLSIDIVSITIPQVVIRSYIYSLIVNDLRGKSVPILARDGLVVVKYVEEPLNIAFDIDRVKLEKYEVNEIRSRLKRTSEETFNKRFKPEKLVKSSNTRLVLDESVEGHFIGVKLGGVHYESNARYKCVFCGLPTHDLFHPASIGYVLYGTGSVERWSPRVPAIGVNLNRLMQSGWLKAGIVACPLCVLDSATVWKTLVQDRISKADYFIQFYFTLPTHYDVARLLSYIARKVLLPSHDAREEDVFEDKLGEAVESPVMYGEVIADCIKEEIREILLVDSTWATYLKVVESNHEGENKDFAYYLPFMARAIFYTGVYPVKFARKLDPYSENRIIMPTHPLYDYDVVDKDLRTQTPLIVIALSLISHLEDELALRRGLKLGDEDRVRAVLNYLRYPFNVYSDFLLRHRAGRVAVEVYREFTKDPVGYYTRALKR